jgi:small subunit ribosomal protein S21
MIIIEIKPGEKLERAIKKLKRKFDSTKTEKLLRARKTYTKPSVKRRAEIKKAIYKEQLNKNID